MRSPEIPKKLIFVYNATSGFGNMVIDGVHKILSPKTYPCSLCALTYGVFSEKKPWKNYRKHAAMETEFLYKNEFQERYASKFSYKFTFPIILSSDGIELEVLMSSEALNEIKDITELIQQLQNGIKTESGPNT